MRIIKQNDKETKIMVSNEELKLIESAPKLLMALKDVKSFLVYGNTQDAVNLINSILEGV